MKYDKMDWFFAIVCVILMFVLVGAIIYLGVGK